MDHMPRHAVRTYHEPFVGGGALFFALRDQIQHAVLSDMNEELMIAYRVIQECPEALLEHLHAYQQHHDSQQYYTVRDGDIRQNDPIACAARFIYLNRTCYNGLYRVNRAGKFNVPIGKYRQPLIADGDNIRAVSRALQNVELRRQPFDCIRPGAGDLVYCDPPYDGTYDQYTNVRFDAAGQEALAETARAWHVAGASVMLSNADTPRIRMLYQKPLWRLHEIQAARAISSKASGRQPVTELIITSYEP